MKYANANSQALEPSTSRSSGETRIMQPKQVEHRTLEIRPKLSELLIAKSELTIAKITQVHQHLKAEIVCWTCGKKGHDMMDCKNLCGNCKDTGHSSITCRYRTLPDREDGKAVLDSELGGILTAAMEYKSKDKATDSSKKQLDVTKQSYRKDVVEKEEFLEEMRVPKGPRYTEEANIPRGPRATEEMLHPRTSRHKASNYERENSRNGRILETSDDLGKGRQEYRTRSYSPHRYGDRGYRNEKDCPGRYRERGYHEMDYSPRRRRYERDRVLMESPRRFHNCPRVIPLEDGKWRREILTDDWTFHNERRERERMEQDIKRE